MRKTYAELSKEFKPNKLVEMAVSHIKQPGKALDIGAGALRDTRYLLEQGFEVTAVDKDETTQEVSKELNNEKLSAITTNLTEWEFPQEVFDLVIAINVLPFIGKDSFSDVFDNVKKSLKPGGVLCFTLFGNKDDWVTNENMSFFDKEEVEQLISDMKIISFGEEEKDGKTIRGDSKHWHIFRIIAQK